MSLRDGWWTLIIPPGINLAEPGIYEWRLDGIGIYVGKSCRLPRRIQEYPNNVRKLISGAPYRRNQPTGYRIVHHQLKQAYDSKIGVIVTVLENCARSELNERERYWIELRKSEAETGGPAVLNGN